MTKSKPAGEEATNRKRDENFDLGQAKLAKLIGQREFFHDMALRDGLRTGSRVYGDSLPLNYHLWPVFNYLDEIDLGGKKCLDIGTFDGMTAFMLAELGAGEIAATCQHDLSRFRLVRAYQGYSNIEYWPEKSLTDFPSMFAPASFDIVVISAMLHHLTSPLDALLEARRLLRRGGLLVCESIAHDLDEPALLLNTEQDDPVFGAPTLFVPTVSALRGMLKLASFETLSETRLLGGGEARETNHERTTFLARAVKPSEISGRSAKTGEIHSKSPKIGAIDFDVWESDAPETPAVVYRGPAGARQLNIWLDDCDMPLCPKTDKNNLASATRFAVGLETDFLSLARKYPDDAFTWKDIYLLGARYPAETMPDGMAWGLKQLGNLHVLDYVRRLGLARIAEIGPGFNFYFPNHLPSWCDYTGLDAPGFYDSDMLSLANRERAGVKMEEGLLGLGKNKLPSGAFDACISVSVLEHIPEADITSACADMFRILRPGGWALHSIDLPTSVLPQAFEQWLAALKEAGFLIDPRKTVAPAQTKAGQKDLVMYEPLSIRARFFGKYKDTIWKKTSTAASNGQFATILTAAQKLHLSRLPKEQHS